MLKSKIAHINPSILSADFMNLESELMAILNADAVHVDVMDNHFVPNLTIGLPVVKSIKNISPIPLDVHLMIENPDKWAPMYAEIGAESVTFHYEAAKNYRNLAKLIKEYGAKAAIAVNPKTNIDIIIDDLDLFDMILVMTVEPGFGNQKFIDSMIDKIKKLRRAIDLSPKKIFLQVDGGININNISKISQAGADVFVAGSSIYNTNDPKIVIDQFRSLLQGNTNN